MKVGVGVGGRVMKWGSVCVWSKGREDNIYIFQKMEK